MSKFESLDTWKCGGEFSPQKSAQSYFGTNQAAMTCSGSACGAGVDGKPAPKPSACGAGDDGKPDPKPTACGSACGVGDK